MPRTRTRKPPSVQTSRVVAVVKLSDVVAGDASGPKWVEVTREGSYPGYRGGSAPFQFTRSDLDVMVANLKKHPAYATNDQGMAIGRVIPWDFNHASEADPTEGDLPVRGAPAQGWTLDLEVRNGPDGKGQLWALTEFIEPARTYVKTGQYQWASVAVYLNAVDQSGKNIGAYVSSIALTNTPFIEGMDKLVASRAGLNGEPIELRRTYWESARNVEEAIAQMRELFGLPETAGIAEIMGQLLIVKGWLTAGNAPLGTDPDYIVSSLRTILNLPTLSTDLSVIENAESSVQVLIEQQASAAGAVLPAPSTETVPTPDLAAVAASKRKDIDMELIKVMASKLQVRESDQAVTNAVDELVELRSSLRSLFKLGRDSNEILLGAAKEAQNAKLRLVEFATALGVEDPEGAVAKLAETIANAAKLKELMPELEQLRGEKKKRDEVEVEQEVDQAIAASKLPASVKPALMLHRQHDPEGFRKEHKVGPGQTPAPAPRTEARQERVTQLTRPNVTQEPLSGGGGNEAIIDLDQFQGSNPTAKAKAYLSTVRKDWDKLSMDDQWIAAVNLRKQKNVIMSSQQS